jgi:hypothetical protein
LVDDAVGDARVVLDPGEERRGQRRDLDLAKLAAGDHQRGHHQRVHRDRRLDPGHRRADVVGDRRNRRVHHRRVERHDELADREGGEHDSGRSCGPAFRPARVPTFAFGSTAGEP